MTKVPSTDGIKSEISITSTELTDTFVDDLPNTLEEEDARESLSKHFTPGLRAHYNEIPPDVWMLDEYQLEESASPTYAERLIRNNFWRNYDRALKKKSLDRISPMMFWDGVCTRQHFQRVVLTRRLSFAWILTPPTKYEMQMRECLDVGIRKLRTEILEAKFIFPNGFLDPKAAGVFIKALEFIDNRVNGPLAKRLEITSENKHLHAHMNVEENELNTATLDELDAKIRSVRAKIESSATLDVGEAMFQEPVMLGESKFVTVQKDEFVRVLEPELVDEESDSLP